MLSTLGSSVIDSSSNRMLQLSDAKCRVLVVQPPTLRRWRARTCASDRVTERPSFTSVKSPDTITTNAHPCKNARMGQASSWWWKGRPAPSRTMRLTLSLPTKLEAPRNTHENRWNFSVFANSGPHKTNLAPTYPWSSDSAFLASLLLGLIFNARSNCWRACAGWLAF
jgi:hypothetical protein